MITPEKIDENGWTAPIHIAQEHLHDRRSMNNLPHDDDTAKNRETRDVVNKHTLPDHVMKIGDDSIDCGANKHHVMKIGDCVANKTNF